MKEELVPRKEVPKLMPPGICIRFAAEMDEVTEETVTQMVDKVRCGEQRQLYLALKPSGEGTYLQMESGNGWIFLQICQDTQEGWAYYSSYNAQYADSGEEVPFVPSDGQSVILKRYTMHDWDLAADCVEWFALTGEPYPGMEWIKGTN